MNVLRSALIITLCLIISSCSKPDFTDSQGNTGMFTDFQGRWMVINYWATWCKPCIEEIPELNKLNRDHSEALVVLGVDFDQHQGEDLKQAIAKLAIEFSVLTNDPAALLAIEKPAVLPTTLIFTPEGKLHRRLTGPQTEQGLLEIIQR